MGTIMEATELVLQTMHEAGVPLNAGKIAELSGLDRKVVDKAMKDLKASGAIVSPVRWRFFRDNTSLIVRLMAIRLSAKS